VSVAIDVPDEDRLTDQLSSVDDGLRIETLEPPFELVGRCCAVVDDHPGELAEDAIGSRVHHEGRAHRFTLQGLSILGRAQSLVEQNAAGPRRAVAFSEVRDYLG